MRELPLYQQMGLEGCSSKPSQLLFAPQLPRYGECRCAARMLPARCGLRTSQALRTTVHQEYSAHVDLVHPDGEAIAMARRGPKFAKKLEVGMWQRRLHRVRCQWRSLGFQWRFPRHGFPGLRPLKRNYRKTHYQILL